MTIDPSALDDIKQRLDDIEDVQRGILTLCSALVLMQESRGTLIEKYHMEASCMAVDHLDSPAAFESTWT